ncbi:helix-turn-helix transcriptional regulator [Maricaulis sp.]|uniref:helix-turn-helix transcriptional regulator n=1 Tax=Maricaulis sp. TaxID=1486257 RepID=UPI003A8EAE41
MSSSYLNTKALAELTGVAASTWSKRRLTGDTPPYRKVGRRVLYLRSDVEAWLDGCARQSTSDA